MIYYENTTMIYYINKIYTSFFVKRTSSVMDAYSARALMKPNNSKLSIINDNYHSKYAEDVTVCDIV